MSAQPRHLMTPENTLPSKNRAATGMSTTGERSWRLLAAIRRIVSFAATSMRGSTVSCANVRA